MIDIVYLCVLFLVIIFFTIKCMYLKQYSIDTREGIELKIKQLWESIDENRKDAELENKILWEAMETTCDHLGEEIDKIKSVKRSS